MQSYIESFRVAMAQAGIPFTGEIIPDGQLNRFHVSGDSRSSKNGWFIFFGDAVPSGAYGCWKRGISKTWCSKSKENMSPDEWMQHQARINTAKEKRDKAKAEAQVKAREKAKQLWDKAQSTNDDYSYLRKKDIKNHGLKSFVFSGKEILIIPLFNVDGVINSLQFIDENGEKNFLTDGAITGNFFPIRELASKADKIGIAEGYITGAQIYEILGCNIVCAMNCGNLLSVARAMRTKYPDAEIVIFADNDQWPDGHGVIDNPGLTKAREAANAIGATVHYPDFTGFNISSKPTDWNDLALIAGVDEVRRQLLENKNDNEPKPLPDALTSVIAFDLEMLPRSIRSYISDVADRQQCPVDFVAVTAVCGLAALLGRKALMRPKQYDDWTVTPNLWGAIIGRPSAMKSPAMKAALEPLRLIELEATKEYEHAKEEYQINKELAELKKASAQDKLKAAIKENKLVEAKFILQEASYGETPPIRKRLIVNDASVEKLGELLNENSNGLILVRDELSGWLAKLAREEHQTDRAFYIECFSGNGHFTYDRIGRGTIDIKNLTLSVIGGIQPSKINPLIRDSIRGVNDDGLVQRLQLTVWPNDIGSWEWVDRAPNEEARRSYIRAFNDLHTLHFEMENENSHCFRFTPEAQELYITWLNEIRKIAGADDTHPALESHLLKMPETIASLALLFEIVDGGRESVGIEATTRALEWGDYLHSHAERLYSITINPGLANAHLILKRIDKLNNEFSARDIQRKGWAGLTEVREIEEALLCLVDYRHLTSLEIPPTTVGGRPTVKYIKNKKYTKMSLK